jgi:ATP-dependent helicase/DNAse subunit B
MYNTTQENTVGISDYKIYECKLHYLPTGYLVQLQTYLDNVEQRHTNCTAQLGV